MAADDRTTTIDEEAGPNEPGMGSALLAVLVMILATGILAALIWLIMVPIQSLPRHHTAVQPAPLASTHATLPAPRL
ncbi:MAG TPA: hypothetical protein VED01_12905 [Burkholderiales bacterium]|nr:hypothetical protein [Burkholderiales bacterium]